MPEAFCSVTEIEQVILNILMNAAQVMSDVKNVNYKTEINIKLNVEDDMIVIKISDNGPGIEKEIIKHIFQPFITTKDVGKGTELGLSITYFIVTDKHKGEIFVESEYGSGACFTIKLPFD